MKNINKIFGLMLITILMSSVNASCSITLNTPEDNTYTTDQTPDFNYTIIGNNTGYNATLVIAGIHYGRNNTLVNNSAYVQTANASIPYGESKEWYIFSSNNDSTMNCTSAIRDITIGRTHYGGMNSIVNLILDTVGLFPTIISLVISVSILTIVGGVILWVVKFLKGK